MDREILDFPVIKRTHRYDPFTWAVSILLLIGFTFATWIGNYYIFGHPEIPSSYKILKALNKLEAPKRFELTAAPLGKFLTAKELYDTYFTFTDYQLEQENAHLLRDYIRNYSETKKLVPYVVGNFKILGAHELNASDAFPSGVVAIAQSTDCPQVMIEHIYPAPSANIPLLRQVLATSIDIKLQKTADICAVVHVEKTDDGRLMVTVVPLLYGTYALNKGKRTSFNLEPPAELNLDAGMPVVNASLLDQSYQTFAVYRRTKGVFEEPASPASLTASALPETVTSSPKLARNEPHPTPVPSPSPAASKQHVEIAAAPVVPIPQTQNSQPPATTPAVADISPPQESSGLITMNIPPITQASAPAVAANPAEATAQTLFSPPAATETVSAKSEPVPVNPAPAQESIAVSPKPQAPALIAKSALPSPPPLAPATHSLPQTAQHAISSPSKTAAHNLKSKTAISKTAPLPVSTPYPTIAHTAPRTLSPTIAQTTPMTPSPAPGVNLQPFLAAEPPSATVGATHSWRVYNPGEMPRGRLLDPSLASELADSGLSGERLYLGGRFVVSASGGKRAVLRPENYSGKDTRVIVDYPDGVTPPPEGTTFTRSEMRPFQITDARLGADGKVNVFAREITASSVATVTAEVTPAIPQRRGRLLDAHEASQLADTGLGSAQLFLGGQFLVTAAGVNRMVLRPEDSGGRTITTTRVIVQLPLGVSPPREGTTLARNDQRPFRIVGVRRGTDGQVNVFVREAPRSL